MEHRLNNLSRMTPDELAAAFRTIPACATELDLSQNHFNYYKTPEELAQALAGIPETIINIRLGGNYLFYNRTHQERNSLLMALARLNIIPIGRLDLYGNGEYEDQRKILPLASLVTQWSLKSHLMARILFYKQGSPPKNEALKELEPHQAIILTGCSFSA